MRFFEFLLGAMAIGLVVGLLAAAAFLWLGGVTRDDQEWPR